MLYFNFLYAPDGGGYQNSISFLYSLINLGFSFNNITFIIYKNTEIHTICISSNIQHIAINKGVINKIIFEISSRKHLCKNGIVFSIFGPPMLTASDYTLNIGGMAISNVFYPDIDFWKNLNPFFKLLKKIKDRYRIYRYTKLDFWIFETNLLMEKAVSEFGFPSKRCRVIKMARSKLIGNKFVKSNTKYNFLKDINNCFLFLCGAHPNKRLHILPKIACKLKQKGFHEFRFVLTANSNNYLRKLINKATQMNVYKHFINIGPINTGDVSTVINLCEFMCTFSRLESFSNNFVEAWAMEKPLLVTKSDWSVDSCKDAAYYLELNDIDNSSKKIIEIVRSKRIKKNLVINGKKILSEYPTPENKAIQYLNSIVQAYNLGKK